MELEVANGEAEGREKRDCDSLAMEGEVGLESALLHVTPATANVSLPLLPSLSFHPLVS